MSEIVLLDTSVYLNVLNVPGFNQAHQMIIAEFRRRVEQGDIFLLPLAAIWETGNHISRLGNGDLRRKYARIFIDEIFNAIDGESPYRPTSFPDQQMFKKWLAEYPDFAQRNKTIHKTGEGVSLSDLSIIKEWEVLHNRHPMSRVIIWSLDIDLRGYDSGLR